MSKRFQLMLSDRQYAYLYRASERTSLSVAELVRRALDEKYPASADPQIASEFTLAVWRPPVGGRRPGLSLEERPTQERR